MQIENSELKSNYNTPSYEEETKVKLNLYDGNRVLIKEN